MGAGRDNLANTWTTAFDICREAPRRPMSTCTSAPPGGAEKRRGRGSGGLFAAPWRPAGERESRAFALRAKFRRNAMERARDRACRVCTRTALVHFGATERAGKRQRYAVSARRSTFGQRERSQRDRRGGYARQHHGHDRLLPPPPLQRFSQPPRLVLHDHRLLEASGCQPVSALPSASASPYSDWPATGCRRPKPRPRSLPCPANLMLRRAQRRARRS
jgi:hypothetical protein